MSNAQRPFIAPPDPPGYVGMNTERKFSMFNVVFYGIVALVIIIMILSLVLIVHSLSVASMTAICPPLR